MSGAELQRCRIPARMVEFLEGSQMADMKPQEGDDGYVAESQALLLRFRRTAPYKDGAWRMKLTAAERELLTEWASWLESAAGDMASDRDPDALADLNAARATIRQVTV
jgi:hypothetical protein